MSKFSFDSGTNTYGRISPQFQISFDHNYNVLVGKNDSGKSTILQFIFKELFRLGTGNGSFCLIGADRLYIQPGLPPQISLQDFNSQLYGQLSSQPKSFDTMRDPEMGRLYSLLLHESNLLAQIELMNSLLLRMDFPPITVGARQQVSIDDINLNYHGSGVRSIIPILASLTCSSINTILIDEPELALEARVQKVLRDILLETSKEKTIIVATQSHLFLNRRQATANFEVTNDGTIQVTRIKEDRDLLGLTYNLLGNSLEDLFFPNNFLIVEGASDQIICEKLASLLSIQPTEVKIIAARGVDNTLDSHKAIENTLIPIAHASSPYSSKVVVLLDGMNSNNASVYEKIKEKLGDRLIILSDSSLEQYIPQELYEKAKRNKDSDLHALSELAHKRQYDSNSFKDEFKLKKEISTDIAQTIELSDLPSLDIIVSALNKAKELNVLNKMPSTNHP